MNAITHDTRIAAPATPHPTHKLKWLLKREFWEHKGGFLWAPLIAGAVFLFFTLLGGGTGQFLFSRHGGRVINFDGQEVPLSQVDWDKMLATASPDDLRQMGEAINGITLMSAFWPLVVFGFVVFFYLLGSLHDERKERPRVSLILQSWNSSTVKQCLGRIRRCNGTHATQHFVLAAGTVQERVAATLDASIRTMAAAFELADFGCWRGIIESVVYEGLYAVGNAVLNGTFQKYTRNRKSQRKGRTQ